MTFFSHLLKIFNFPPYFCKIYTFPPVSEKLHFPYIFLLLPLFSFNLCVLRNFDGYAFMLYTYWTPHVPRLACDAHD